MGSQSYKLLMKRYEITKIVFADDMEQLMHMERGGEIVSIQLKDDVKNYSDVGFKKENGERQGNNMVPKVR